MSPEFYAIIGTAVGLGSLIISWAGIALYLIGQTNRRMDRLDVRLDRLEDRMNRLEDRMSRMEERMSRMEERFIESINLLREQVHSLDKRIAKLEWMLDTALYGKPVTFPPETDDAAAAD